MIGTIDVEVNAAHPNLPLCEFAAFVGSPSHVRVRNVPRGVGNWQITAVYLSVNYPDNSLPSVSLTHVGALWTGTIQGSASAGRSVNGYQITADGVDEDGNAITGYVLGVGDVYVLNRDGSITVGETTYYFHLCDTLPTTPKKSDVYNFDGVVKYYDGTAWRSFGGSAIDVVAPSTDPADAGKAADAKATGDALAARPTKAQLDAGWWSEWTVTPAQYAGQNLVIAWDAEVSTWLLKAGDNVVGVIPNGHDSDTELHFGETSEIEAIATRHRVSAPVPTKPEDIGAQPAGSYATAAQGVKADAALSRAEAEAGFTEWVFRPATFEDKVCSAAYEGDNWYLYLDGSMTEQTDSSPEDATSLSFIDGNITATRTRLPTMADLAKKQNTISDLAAIRAGAAAGASAYQKPSGGIPASDMTQAVQTSLGKADAALPLSGGTMTGQLMIDTGGPDGDVWLLFRSGNYIGFKFHLYFISWEGREYYLPSDSGGTFALVSNLRYDLPANATVISSASSEVVEGETVTYGAATLADRTGNRVSITATLDELRVTFPPEVSGKLRDFGLRVEVGTGSAALTAPALVPVAPTGETIKLENNAKQIPALADGTATAKGVTLLYFSETAPGLFLAKGEEVKEVL